MLYRKKADENDATPNLTQYTQHCVPSLEVNAPESCHLFSSYVKKASPKCYLIHK